MDIDEMSVLPVSNSTQTSRLRYLIIQDSSLSTEQLRLLVSKATALRHLKLTFRKKEFESIVDIHDWEQFVRSELSFLHRLEFFFSYVLSSNDMIDLESLVIPFQEPFWLNEKRWFVVCEYTGSSSHMISLYTISNIYAPDVRYHNSSDGIL